MNNPLSRFLLAIADDELVLGHRDAEICRGPDVEADSHTLADLRLVGRQPDDHLG